MAQKKKSKQQRMVQFVALAMAVAFTLTIFAAFKL